MRTQSCVRRASAAGWRGVVLSIALVAVLGCEGERGQEDITPHVRIEDGVTVVENPGLDVADSTAWSFEAEPVLTIGQLEGPHEYLLGRVRGLDQLSSGDIVVADGQTMQLRIFDDRGAFLRTVGRQGEGPGEFYELDGVRATGTDSVLALNGHGGFVHLLDPEFGFVERTRPDLSAVGVSAGAATLLDAFDDGYLLMGDYRRACPVDAEGPCADSVRLMRTDIRGNVVATYGTFAHSVRSRRSLVDGPSFAWTYPHPQPVWATGGDRLYYLDDARREIRVYGPTGTLERRVVVAGQPSTWAGAEMFPMPDEAENDAANGARRAMVREMRSSLPTDSWASFASMVVDDSGRIWLREFVPPDVADGRRSRWFVFGPDGRLLYSLRAPTALEHWWSAVGFQPPPVVDGDLMLAVTTNDVGLEQVVGYRVGKR